MKVFKNDDMLSPVKAWVDHVGPIENLAMDQLKNIAKMPFIHKHIACMPDVHAGMGATVGSVIATKNVIIPAACGVDIGCGMAAVRTSLTADALPDNLNSLRTAIENAVPHGRTMNGQTGDRGAWGTPPREVEDAWGNLAHDYHAIIDKYPGIMSRNNNNLHHLGTLGTGNHFLEVCLDEANMVWFMLHSGSRGVGNKIGTFFIEKAREEMRRWFVNLPDIDLAYLPEGSQYFYDYLFAVNWAQNFAATNRSVMMSNMVRAAGMVLPSFTLTDEVISCHHNYIAMENHFNANVYVTRKGAVRARKGDLAIIPGSMGARSFIARGKGNPDSFHSCSHGAGRKMSRTKAKQTFTLDDHLKATAGVECRKDEGVLDETPGAYKDIDDVMRSQEDLVEIVHTLKQVVCVKG